MNSLAIVLLAVLAAARASVHGGAELYSGLYDGGLVGHAGLFGHAGLVGAGGVVGPAVAYSAPGVVHAAYSAPAVVAETAVAPSATLVQNADTEAIVAGPSGTVARSGGVVAHSVAGPAAVYAAHSPAAVYAAHSPAVYAHGAGLVAGSYLARSGLSSGVIATDHVGDSVVAGPSGTITTNAGAYGHYAAPVAHYASRVAHYAAAPLVHGW